mmetsp:Transcript_32140/g.72494  ORF Transcript_32140/g.72494 Transcript_32140/m.72494 type:complete len:215 (+) Transcript_32140:949-1593(+)
MASWSTSMAFRSCSDLSCSSITSPSSPNKRPSSGAFFLPLGAASLGAASSKAASASASPPFFVAAGSSGDCFPSPCFSRIAFMKASRSLSSCSSSSSAGSASTSERTSDSQPSPPSPLKAWPESWVVYEDCSFMRSSRLIVFEAGSAPGIVPTLDKSLIDSWGTTSSQLSNSLIKASRGSSSSLPFSSPPSSSSSSSSSSPSPSFPSPSLSLSK